MLLLSGSRLSYLQCLDINIFIHCCVHESLFSFVSYHLENDKSPSRLLLVFPYGTQYIISNDLSCKLSPPSYNKGAHEPKSGSYMSPTWQRASEGSEGLVSRCLTVSCNSGEHNGSRNHCNTDGGECCEKTCVSITWLAHWTHFNDQKKPN